MLNQTNERPEQTKCLWNEGNLLTALTYSIKWQPNLPGPPGVFAGVVWLLWTAAWSRTCDGRRGRVLSEQNHMWQLCWRRTHPTRSHDILSNKTTDSHGHSRFWCYSFKTAACGFNLWWNDQWHLSIFTINKWSVHLTSLQWFLFLFLTLCLFLCVRSLVFFVFIEEESVLCFWSVEAASLFDDAVKSSYGWGFLKSTDTLMLKFYLLLLYIYNYTFSKKEEKFFSLGLLNILYCCTEVPCFSYFM